MQRDWNEKPLREVETDVLVIGGGGAALRAALEAREAGADVLIAVKGNLRGSGATFYSVAEVGAFNVPDGAGDSSDNPGVHAGDILYAAQGMADPRLVEILTEEAEEALHYLEGKGVPFEKTEQGGYLTFRACFSSRPRSHVIRDHFKPIMRALGSEVTAKGIRGLDQLMVVDLVVRDGICLGALAIDREGAPVLLRAGATIMTTGGASQLFSKNLYPADITGDGYAMAWRAGAHLTNMEFMQAGVSILSPFVNLFGNYLWDARPNLTDAEGQPVIQPFLPEGVTRDAVLDAKENHFPFSARGVSRYVEISIQKTINSGKGTPEGGVWMDFRDTDFDKVLGDSSRSIAHMWPLTYDWYLAKGVDLYKDRVQITCSGHAINGGLRIDAGAGSNIRGLFAAGETAAGPHGADRLGGNMAMTCQVFGARAGRAAAALALAEGRRPLPDRCAAEQARLSAVMARKGEESAEAVRLDLQALATRHLLVVRDGAGLAAFLSGAAALRDRLARVPVDNPAALRFVLETENLLETGCLMARAAQERTESRGGHYREDFPAADPGQETSIIFDRNRPEGFFRAALGSL